MLTDGIWSPTKCSMFYISRMDGVLDAWDLLQQQNEPILSIKVCDEPLLCKSMTQTKSIFSTRFQHQNVNRNHQFFVN